MIIAKMLISRIEPGIFWVVVDLMLRLLLMRVGKSALLLRER
jgi:hypothetical protein